MKLWRKNEAPVGGWFYIMENGWRVPQKGTSTSLDRLVDEVVQRMNGNEITVPEFIHEMVEDQICMRQPEDKCRYSSKAGDMLSAAISMGAGAIDGVFGTKLKSAARRCGTCGRRRVKLNQL